MNSAIFVQKYIYEKNCKNYFWRALHQQKLPARLAASEATNYLANQITVINNIF
jgi:hypothetical protein